MIRAFVGSGGKTGTILKQAAAYREAGLRVLVTTSTQMGAKEETIVGDDPSPIIHALLTQGIAMAGIKAVRAGKIAALSEKTFREAAAYADVVLVEADGSRQHPLKFPNDTEPVIPAETEEIVVVCGLSAIGQPARDVCHRLELVKAAIGIEDDTIITARHVQRLVRAAYLEPLAKRYPSASLRLYPCQRDTLYLRAVAALLEADMDVDLIREDDFRSAAVYGCGACTLDVVRRGGNGLREGAITLRPYHAGDKVRMTEEDGSMVLSLPLQSVQDSSCF